VGVEWNSMVQPQWYLFIAEMETKDFTWQLVVKARMLIQHWPPFSTRWRLKLVSMMTMYGVVRTLGLLPSLLISPLIQACSFKLVWRMIRHRLSKQSMNSFSCVKTSQILQKQWRTLNWLMVIIQKKKKKKWSSLLFLDHLLTLSTKLLKKHWTLWWTMTTMLSCSLSLKCGANVWMNLRLKLHKRSIVAKLDLWWRSTSWMFENYQTSILAMLTLQSRMKGMSILLLTPPQVMILTLGTTLTMITVAMKLWRRLVDRFLTLDVTRQCLVSRPTMLLKRLRCCHCMLSTFQQNSMVNSLTLLYVRKRLKASAVIWRCMVPVQVGAMTLSLVSLPMQVKRMVFVRVMGESSTWVWLVRQTSMVCSSWSVVAHRVWRVLITTWHSSQARLMFLISLVLQIMDTN